MKTRLNPVNLPQPRGPYSQVVASDPGVLVVLSGQVALDESGSLVGGGDAEEQSRQIYRNIQTALRHLGGDLADVVKLTVYDTDIDAHTEAIRRARREFFKDEYPASTKIQVERLADREFLLEIDATAVIERP